MSQPFVGEIRMFAGGEEQASGSLCDVTTAFGASRTGNYAIAIAGADSVTTPEPGSILLLFAGGAWIALRRRHFSSRTV
jgi:PEP-CTERM motif